jgi:hypothetical protein
MIFINFLFEMQFEFLITEKFPFTENIIFY